MAFSFNPENCPRKVIVHYGAKYPKGCQMKKLFVFPPVSNKDRENDCEFLREKVHEDMLASSYCEKHLRVGPLTTPEDIAIYQCEETYSQPHILFRSEPPTLLSSKLFLLDTTTVLEHLNENLVAKMKN